MRLLRHRRFRHLRELFAGLPRRALLTIQYHGWREFFFRLVTFPLRLTPLGPRLRLRGRALVTREARSWYPRDGRFVTVVIPTYGAPDVLFDCVDSVRRTIDGKRTRIVVTDDGSPEQDRKRLRRLRGIELVESDRNTGFAANVNRGLERAQGDVVVLNSDVIAHEYWLELLQFRAYAADDIGIVGPKLLYEDGTIQSAGSHRNLGAPEWFDHRYRFRSEDHGPANQTSPVIATTGACLYVKRELLDRIGRLDERFGMAYEDVDWCLRAWDAGYRVIYAPEPTLTHLESKTRGMEQGERELATQRYFWDKWGDWFDRREVRAPDGRLRIIYVTEDTGVGGGHRVVFEHLNGLAARGHHAELYTLDGPPDWFSLRVPVRVFDDYAALERALGEQDAIKVATWWNTAAPVWMASLRRGIPVYFVQDIESSYYADDSKMQDVVLNSYRQEFRYLTTSGWVSGRLRELGVEPAIVSPGVDLDTFRPLNGAAPAEGAVLGLGRTNPLKNFPLTVAGWRALPEPRPELVLFGIEPEVATDEGMRYVTGPSDAQVNELLNGATAFLQTSVHEGFCLPVLEAMAAGTPVVSTDANGNRDFCRDGENCLMPEAKPEAVCAAIERVLSDPDLRARLREEGFRTAQTYGWARKHDDLERFFQSLPG